MEIEYLRRLLGAHSHQLDEERTPRDLKIEVLSALTDSIIDADKVDYLIRDSSRCGVPYGIMLDVDRLLRVMTVAVLQDKSDDRRVTIGVYEKGESSARALGLSRALLYSSVYWHHASRVIKAMLQYGTVLSIGDDVLDGAKKDSIDAFRRELSSFVLQLIPSSSDEAIHNENLRISKESRKEKMMLDQEVTDHVERTIDGVGIEEESVPHIIEKWYPGISWSDWKMIKWLAERETNDPRGAQLLNALTERHLYKRVFSFEWSYWADEDIRKTLEGLNWRKRIELSMRLEDQIVKSVQAIRTPSRTLNPDELESLRKNNLLILVDIPNPRTKRGFQQPLAIVPELKQKSYYQEMSQAQQDSEWSQVLSSMMDASAPVRLLCHPALRNDASRALLNKKGSIANVIKDVILGKHEER